MGSRTRIGNTILIYTEPKPKPEPIFYEGSTWHIECTYENECTET